MPVYISDKHFLPFSEFLNWEDFSIIIKPNEISKLHKILKNKLENNLYSTLQRNVDKVNQEYFNFSYMSEYILDRVC